MSVASPQLAILTPRWGAVSETFIHRHLTQIAPGSTVAMSRDVLNPDWCPGVPLLSIRSIHATPMEQVPRRMGLWQLDRRARALRRFLSEHHSSIVLGEWLNFAAKWFPAVRGMNLRFFANAHGYDVTAKTLGQLRTRLLYRQLGRMDGVITMSQLSRQRLIDMVKLPPDKIHVVPYGVEIPAARHAADAEETVCLSVGRMVAKKGPLLTLQAFHDARQDHPNLRLEFVGDGPLLPDCRKYCVANGLSDVVTLHGGQPPSFVMERLSRADIFLLHSVTSADGDEEGMPVAILEAMANGLPVLSTYHGGIPEAVVDGETGFLVAEHDWRGMASRLRTLASDAAIRRRMGERARQRAVTHFSAERQIKRLREILF